MKSVLPALSVLLLSSAVNDAAADKWGCEDRGKPRQWYTGPTPPEDPSGRSIAPVDPEQPA